MPTITGDNSDNTLFGTAGDDEIFALGGNDVIHPGAGNDTVYAGDGDDLIYWEGGRDTVYGGNGRDIISLAGLLYGSTISLADGWYIQGTSLTGSTGLVILYSIEGVIGSNYDDSVYLWDDPRDLYIDGAGGNDVLRGGFGDDEIFGGDGDYDSVASSRGNDTMDGGDGISDLINYSSFDAGQGIVADLRTGIVIDEYGDTDTVTGLKG